jgi:aminoglycoside phosphotransferase (APT) family kinase protein
MIHRDFRPGNLMVYNGKLQEIIDWSSGRAGFAEEDFISMEHGEWSNKPSSKKAFLDGYGSIRNIPDYSALMPLLRLSKSIATIGFMVKRGTIGLSNTNFYQLNREFLETFF